MKGSFTGLGFESKELRDEFKSYWAELNLPFVRLALVLAAFLGFGFYMFDRTYLDPAISAQLNAYQLAILAPAAAALFVLTYVPRSWAYISSGLWCGCVLSGYFLSRLMSRAGAEDVDYYLFSTILIMVFAAALMRTRFWASTTAIVALTFLFATTAARMDVVAYRAPYLVLGITIIGGLLIYAAYAGERALRQLFLAERLAKDCAAQSRKSERDRLKWLENLAGFLRHEVTSQIIGARSSLTLIAGSRSSDDVEKYVERANLSIDRLLKLLESATKATTLESALAGDEKQEIDLSAMLRAKAREFAVEFPEVPIRLQGVDSLCTFGDPLRLNEMFDNLLMNAIEHAQPGSEVELNCTRSNEEISVEVTNAGDPLPADSDRIFEPYVSLGDKRSTDRGHGIGLFVARKIADHHGGTLTASNRREGSGATFTVTLPLYAAT